MYLSELEIVGFKSFAQRVKMRFDSGITAVVGPNGCGKTNIVDSIRWVLGEQRYSTLRTDHMEDVIFNGTRSRKPLGMAEVSLTIENTNGILPIEYSEVTVSRRVFRSGESEYLLNGITCRLKDILDLFMDTGMGSDAYSVIELKMVETILSSQTEERRRLFEEAAGVTKYKHRRKAAYRKLESVRQDLLRVNDVIAEVKKTAASLERQAKRAEQYTEISQKLHLLELEVMAFEAAVIAGEIVPLEGKRGLLIEQKRAMEESMRREEERLEELRARLNEMEESRRLARADVEEKRDAVRKAEQSKALAEERLRALRERIDELVREQGRLSEQRCASAEELVSLAAAAEELRVRYAEAEEAAARGRETLEAVESRLVELKQSLAARQEERRTSEARCGALEREAIRAEADRSSLEDRIRSLEESIAQSEHAVADAEQRVRELSQRDKQIRLRFAEAELAVAQAEEHRRQLQQEVGALRSREQELVHSLKANEERIAFLRALMEKREGVPDAVKFLLEKRPGTMRGTVGEILSAPEQYRTAAEAALSDSVHGLIVDESAQAEDLARLLQKEERGKASFFVLNETPLFHSMRDIVPAHGAIGWLTDVVNCSEEYRPLVNMLLDRYLIVRDFSAAAEVVHRYPDVRCVTLRGELVSSHGAVRAGGRSFDGGSFIGTKDQIRELEARESELSQQLESRRLQLRNAEHALEAIDLKALTEQMKSIEHEMTAIETQIAQVEFEKRRIGETVTGFLAKLVPLRADAAAAAQVVLSQQAGLKGERALLGAAAEAERRAAAELEQTETETGRQAARTNEAGLLLVSLKGDERNLQIRREHAERSAADAERGIRQRSLDRAAGEEEMERTHLDLAAAEEAIALRSRELETAVERERTVASEMKTVSESVRAIEPSLREARRGHDAVVDELQDLGIRLSELKMRGESLRLRARDEFEVELEPRIPEEPFDAAAAHEDILAMKSKIRALGGVNFEAFSEFQKEKERLEFLTAQREDLNEAEETLLQTIEEINTTAQRQFLETFEKIRENFILTFQSLFDEGDEADLRLEEGADPLEAKIFITAKPRGKRPTSIELLSQGEKTLTATALLFAIYLVKPSPFCVLDEVDAPLDDANVARFTRILQKFSNNTQFIVITHNKRTMEAANVLYGVTMEEEGVSKLVSVRFRDEVLV